MSESIVALEGRVTRLEVACNDGFSRIEMLLRQEINDLKAEQISELRKSLDRLADDQRRVWEQIYDLQRQNNQRIGSGRTIGGISNFISAIIGGVITAAATYLSAGGRPHP